MPLKIVFISCVKNAKRFWLDPSFRYRCENLGLALQQVHYKVKYRHIKENFKTPNADVVVFHRPRNSWRFRWLMHQLRKRKTMCIADVDDLIFDPAMAKHSPGVINQQHALETIKELFTAHQQAFSYFDYFTVSTKPLKQHLQGHFPHKYYFVLHNAVHESWKKTTDPTLGLHLSGDENSKEEKIITYLPGTHSHDRDFLEFADGISAFLTDNKEIKLEVTGPLSLDLDLPAKQIITRNRVPFDQYHRYLIHGWVNLMPLEKTPFTHCKSALKVMEAGYWNIPTIASVNPDTKRFQNSGAILVDSSEAVYEALDQLKNFSSSVTTGKQLREEMQEKANARRYARHWIEFVLDHLPEKQIPR